MRWGMAGCAARTCVCLGPDGADDDDDAGTSSLCFGDDAVGGADAAGGEGKAIGVVGEVELVAAPKGVQKIAIQCAPVRTARR